jgi:adenylate/guanylate cyclase
MFRKIAYVFIAVFISIFLSALYIFSPGILRSFDDRMRDAYFLYRGEMPNGGSVVIVDIDEASLRALGQWPWSRDKLSKIIENLTSAGVAVIGIDAVFAEEDRTSPSLIAKKLNLKENLQDYDLQFANTLANSPVILGYGFDLVDEDGDKRAPKIPAILIEKNKKEDFAIKALGATLNIEPIQNAGYSSGFFNVIPDSSGMIRSVPLVISFDDVLYPSLALEIARVVSGEKKIFINYDELGIENISIGQTVIPTDVIGGITVNYRGGFKNFKYLSAKDIYDGEFNADEVEGKIVLIGTSAIGLYDLRTTPFDSAFAGVEVHANAIDNILSGDFIYKPSYADGVTVILVVFSSFLIVFSVTSMNFYGKILTFFAASFLYVWGSYYALFHEGIILNILFPLAAISLAFVTTLAFDYFYSIKSERAIRAKFASKVSKSVMDDILKNTNGNELSIKNKEVTIFFSDIRGFTSISEKLGAKELIALLNRYMQPMSEIIIKNQGTIDKFIGDAVMAYWNAPLDIQNHADLAVKSALEQFEALKILNSQLEKENLPQISIGIGINTGEVIVGEMGCEIRSDYTVIGDAINLGSRLESLCKFYGSNLNISNFTKERLKEKYMFRFLDLVRVKGKNEPVEIWRVLGYGEAQSELKKELEIYDKAIALYKKAKFLEALEIFKELEIKANKQDKKIYEIYIARCEQFIKTPPSDFDGVFDHATKS